MNFKGIYFLVMCALCSKNDKNGIAMGLGMAMERDELLDVYRWRDWRRGNRARCYCRMTGSEAKICG